MELEIYEYLCENHMGKANLIKNHELRELFHVGGDKKMCKIIQNIRESNAFPLLVGSVSGNCGGHFICATEEKAETIANTRHRANEMLRACHIME